MTSGAASVRPTIPQGASRTTPATKVVLSRPVTTIRAFVPEDAEGVAQLFRKTFGKRGLRASQNVAPYLIELFLHHPWHDPALSSRVCIDTDGRVRGFIGILPVRMTFRERPLLAATAGSLMVDNPDEDPTAGARLLRSFFSGPQELSFSETSNPLSQLMWEKLGGEAVPGYSMEWLRVFKPAGLALAVAEDRLFSTRVFRPLAGAADRVFRRVSRLALTVAAVDHRPTRAVAMDVPAFAGLVQELSATFALRPNWSRDVLTWQLEHATRKERFGPLTCVAVLGRRGETLGGFTYHAKPDGIAVVLQILARADATGAVVDRLFAETAERGCVAVRGRSTPDLLNALLLRRCVLLHRSSLTVRTRHADLLATIREGGAMMVGLAGEAWTRLISDDFT